MFCVIILSMTKTKTALLAVLFTTLIIFVISVYPVAAVENTTTSEAPIIDDEVAPGTHLSATVVTQQEHIKGEMGNRTLGIELSKVSSESGKAKVLAKHRAEVSEEINAIRTEKTELVESYRAGEITQSEFVTQMSRLAQQTHNSEAIASNIQYRGSDMSREMRQEHGLKTEDLQNLVEDANRLQRGHLSEVSDKMGKPMEVGPPEDRGHGHQSDKGENSGHNMTPSDEDNERQNGNQGRNSDNGGKQETGTPPARTHR